MRGRIATVARSVGPILLTVLLLGILFFVVDGSEVLRQLQGIDPTQFLAAILMMILGTVLATLRYRGVLRAYHPSNAARFVPLMQLNLLTLFSAHFLPFGALADGMRVLVSRRLLNLPVAVALESVVADRGLAALSLAMLGLLLLPLQILEHWPTTVVGAQSVAFAGLLSLAALGAFAAFALPRLLGPFAVMGQRFVGHFASAQGMLAQTLLALGTLLLFGGMLYVLASGLGAPLPLTIAIAIAPAVYLSQVIPIFYAGFGSREVVLAAILVPAGVLSDTTAIALALSIGICNLVASLPGALFAWPLLTRAPSTPTASLSPSSKRR